MLRFIMFIQAIVSLYYLPINLAAEYVSLIDANNSQITVKSTDTNDARAFMIIKIVSGG